MLDKILNLPVSKDLIVVFIGALPIFELRGALPIGINLFKMPWYYALFLSVVGNMLPVPFLLLLFEWTSRVLYRVPILKKPLDWVSSRTRKHSMDIARYGLPGLLVFVAIPVPFTGAWTASLVATLLGIKFFPAFITILGGVIIAGAIVTVLSLMGWAGATIAGVGLIGMTVAGMCRANRKSKRS